MATGRKRTTARIKEGFALACIVVSTSVGATKPLPEHLFGPDPGRERFRQFAEADIGSRLIDPESARITWLGGYYKGSYKPLFARTLQGYVGCGTVNAKNHMGGYAGAHFFITLIDYDRVLYTEFDGAGGLVDLTCRDALRDGLILKAPPEALTPGAVGVPAELSIAAYGLTIKAMPEGAYVSAVAPGCVAAASGLEPGMVIASINAIPLGGMDEAMLKVVAAARPGAAVLLIGGDTVMLGSKP